MTLTIQQQTAEQKMKKKTGTMAPNFCGRHLRLA